ncbi:MAG TPA: hypothetical protein VFG83_05070 [Kofleriaceae bacterium]|nr:hypothetical protein [Kofleriaceae bacterium]
MSKARPVFPGAVVFSTRRVHKRQFLLRPSPRVNQIVGYIVAVLAERYGIRLHALCVLSNHTHSVATDPNGRIVEFQRDCHAFIARHLNAISGDFESLWSREPTSRIECTDDEDILAKVVYTMANPVAARLVAHGHHWPGLRRAWPQKPKVIKRPRGFFRGAHQGGTWPETATLTFYQPPCRDDLSGDELAEVLTTAIVNREQALREAARQAGKRFLGRRTVLTQSRLAFPVSDEERKPSIIPGRSRRQERSRQRRHWLEAYERARYRRLAGDRDVLFPYGTYKLRIYHHVPCEPPPAQTLLVLADRLSA